MEEQHAALDTAPLATSIRVETKKSVHAYWLIEGECTEAEWRDVQERLIAYFGGDEKIKNPSRTMRLPFFNHVAYNEEDSYSYKPVEVVTFEPSRRYTVAEMLAAFPAPRKSQPLIFAGSSTSSFSPDWVELNAELKRRISQTGRMNRRGIIETKGVCHSGRSNSAVMFNPATGAVKCLNGCAHAEVLRAFGLPEKPVGSSTSSSSQRQGEEGAAETSSSPKLSRQALYGLAGEIVSEIAKESEAHPAALLSQLLVTFGNIIGFSPHFRTEADKQGTNLFAVVVGKSARAGRKGTSWGYIERLFTDAASDWKASNLQHGGLSSGEGVIKRLRDDATFALGFQDKRLLVVEGEFSAVMRVKNREGNILQDVLRNAWDRKPLCVLRRDEPEKATDPHLSFIGHITSDELNLTLRDVDFHNGYFNRILWFCSQRTQRKPRGGRFFAQNVEPYVRRLKEVIDFAQGVGEMDFDEEADRLWTDIYNGIDDTEGGRVGAILARAEPQIIRLAMLYALLDCSGIIKRVHLEAAKALWDYSEASVRHIFGGNVLSKKAQKLRGWLFDADELGLSKTEIHKKFGNRLKAPELDKLCLELALNGLAFMVSAETSGRAEERWYAAEYSVQGCESDEFDEAKAA
jgi:hypothetical protein